VEKYGTAGQATDDNIILRMRFAWRTAKSTDTHSEHVTLSAFPLQQWLRERASKYVYTYIACLVCQEIHTSLASRTNGRSSVQISCVKPIVMSNTCSGFPQYL
jgi:hypothetical protein